MEIPYCMACGHPEKGNSALEQRTGAQPREQMPAWVGLARASVTKEAWLPGRKKEARSHEARPGLVILWYVHGP